MTKRVRIALRLVGVLAALLLIAAGALWLRLRPDSKGRVVPLFESIDMSALRQFTDAIRYTTSIQVFEGLPHQSWENQLLESEIASKETFKNHGHHFYSIAISPAGDDGDALRSHALNPSGFEEWSGMKTCGGYHPDWMIRWTSPDGATHELHLCFGCHEAKFYGPGYQLYCNVPKKSYDGFKAILERYASQRPSKPKAK